MSTLPSIINGKSSSEEATMGPWAMGFRRRGRDAREGDSERAGRALCRAVVDVSALVADLLAPVETEPWAPARRAAGTPGRCHAATACYCWSASLFGT